MININHNPEVKNYSLLTVNNNFSGKASCLIVSLLTVGLLIYLLSQTKQVNQPEEQDYWTP